METEPVSPYSSSSSCTVTIGSNLVRYLVFSWSLEFTEAYILAGGIGERTPNLAEGIGDKPPAELEK